MNKSKVPLFFGPRCIYCIIAHYAQYGSVPTASTMAFGAWHLHMDVSQQLSIRSTFGLVLKKSNRNT